MENDQPDDGTSVVIENGPKQEHLDRLRRMSDEMVLSEFSMNSAVVFSFTLRKFVLVKSTHVVEGEDQKAREYIEKAFAAVAWAMSTIGPQNDIIDSLVAAHAASQQEET